MQTTQQCVKEECQNCHQPVDVPVLPPDKWELEQDPNAKGHPDYTVYNRHLLACRLKDELARVYADPKLLKQAKARKSYGHWAHRAHDLIELIHPASGDDEETGRIVAQLLRQEDDMIDNYHGYGSQTNAWYSSVSVALVIKDLGLE